MEGTDGGTGSPMRDPSRDVDLDETRWVWFKGLGLWDSVTGHDARNCGVGLGWGLVGTMLSLSWDKDHSTRPVVSVDKSTCEAGSTVSYWLIFSHSPSSESQNCRARVILVRSSSAKAPGCETHIHGIWSVHQVVEAEAVLLLGKWRLWVTKSGGRVKAQRRHVQAKKLAKKKGAREAGEKAGQEDQGVGESEKRYSVMK